MAWGRKARRIAELEADRKHYLGQARDAVGREKTAKDKMYAAQLENDSLKRENDHLHSDIRGRREAVVDREQEIHTLKARTAELEWAVHLLNRVLANKTNSSLEAPLTGVSEETIEVVREAVRERDIVVTWDGLYGAPEVHFPKKSERRAPWSRATGGMVVAISAADLIYDPSRGSQSPFSPIGNPA